MNENTFNRNCNKDPKEFICNWKKKSSSLFEHRLGLNELITKNPSLSRAIEFYIV